MSAVDVKMEILVLARSLKSSILNSTNFLLDKTFWGVGSAVADQFILAKGLTQLTKIMREEPVPNTFFQEMSVGLSIELAVKTNRSAVNHNI